MNKTEKNNPDFIFKAFARLFAQFVQLYWFYRFSLHEKNLLKLFK